MLPSFSLMANGQLLFADTDAAEAASIIRQTDFNFWALQQPEEGDPFFVLAHEKGMFTLMKTSSYSDKPLYTVYLGEDVCISGYAHFYCKLNEELYNQLCDFFRLSR